MKFIFSILLLMVLFSCKEEINKEDNKKKTQTKLISPPPLTGFFGRNITFSKEEIRNSILGEYSTPRHGYGGSTLRLYVDSLYEYESGGCTSGTIDSGHYSLNNDTLFFKSIIKPNKRNNDVFMQDPLLNFAILKGYKIMFPLSEIKKFQILYKLNIGYENFESLNKKGDGKLIKLDTLNRIIEEGEYRNYKLWNGSTTSYPNSVDRIAEIKNYKNGKIDTSRN